MQALYNGYLCDGCMQQNEYVNYCCMAVIRTTYTTFLDIISDAEVLRLQ